MSKVNLTTFENLIERGDIDTVVMAFPDGFGRLMGKRITGHFFLSDLVDHGMHVCDYLLACDVEMQPVSGYSFSSWDQGYGDMRVVADTSTFRRIPWLEKTGFVLCDLYRGDPERPVSVAPREILKRQRERARELGFAVMGGSELEFYLFRDTYEGARKKGFHKLAPYGWYIEDYHLLQTSKTEWLIREIRNQMEDAGVPVEFSKGEWGPGQQEINLRYADVLEMSDRHVLYKHGAKEIASQRDVAITFMAKWHEKWAGSSCHLHASLWDDGREQNLFTDSNTRSGRSRVFDHWLAGQLKYAPELFLFFAPTVNAYKRFQPGSFAPTRVAWGLDNRTVGFRVVGRERSLRVENRIPGADVNPYLAFAATIAAGLAGIEEQLELPPVCEGDGYAAETLDRMPTTIEEAIERLGTSTLARAALGDDVVDHYRHAARIEAESLQQRVSCLERERYFERI